MTEIEIIADMECCLKMDCDKCSRRDNTDCATGLYGDAIKVMKLMQNALVMGSDAIDTLKAENGRLQTQCNQINSKRFDKDDIVDKVSQIVKEAVAHGEYQDNWGKLSEKMRKFLYLVEASDKYVVVLGEEMPEIKLKHKM